MKTEEGIQHHTSQHQKQTPLAMVYLRSATAQQYHTNQTLNDQKERCEHFASKNGIKIIGVIEDCPTSVVSDFQNDWIESIQTLEDTISYLIVASFDRLSRNHVVTRQYISELKQLGIETLSVTEDATTKNLLSLNTAD